MVQILILTSTEDKASMNIREKFLDGYNFDELDWNWCEHEVYKLKSFPSEKENVIFEKCEIYLGLTDESMIHINDLRLNKAKFNPDLLIVASRHRSKAKRPAFLVHTTGNWSDKAEFGGEPRDLSHSSALLHKAGFLSLIEQFEYSILSAFSLDIEVTHHGPTSLDIPLIFVELGSSEEEWEINEGGELVANSIVDTIIKYMEFLGGQKTQKIGLGFGGTHYAPNFRRIILNSDLAMSFICPKYFVQDLNFEMIKMMIENTIEKVDYFIIDWKGTNSADKKHLIPILEELNIPIKKTKDF